jgi:prepilin-type processing-associated H-X9-DG protein
MSHAWAKRLGWYAALGGLPLAFMIVFLPARQSPWVEYTHPGTQCQTNLRLIGLALLNYHDVHQSFPAGTTGNPKLSPEHRLGWMLEIFPFLESCPCKLNIDPSKPWEDPANRYPTWTYFDKDGVGAPKIEEARYSFFQCPSGPNHTNRAGRYQLDYVAIAGLGPDSQTLPVKHPRAGVFGYDRLTRLSDIVDGPASTMMVIETTTNLGPWTAGGPTSVRGLDPRRPYLGKGGRFGGNHVGGANVLFADGSVRYVEPSTNPKVFEGLSTIAGRVPRSEGP